MKHYIQLMRPKHWAKNLFLFIPLFFAGKFFDVKEIFLVFGGFWAFSFLASSIYIINDYRDIEDDRRHPEKKFRPLAAGTVNKTAALALSAILVAAAIVVGYAIDYQWEIPFCAWPLFHPKSFLFPWT